MDWYYTRNGAQAGPVSEEEVQRLAAEGVITPDSLVWQAGMSEWRPYREVMGGAASPVGAASVGTFTEHAHAPGAHAPGSFCTECGRSFPAEDLMQYGQSRVCADCKDRFLQRVREGVPVSMAPVRYAGFWIRFVAICIDGLILGAANLLVNLVVGLVAGNPLEVSRPLGIGSHFYATLGITYLVNAAIGIGYQVYFLTRHAATPGKMALGLKVITTNGAPISTGLATGRYFCYILDSLILFIGYIIAAFDSQKRALHDHICNTRVIYAP